LGRVFGGRPAAAGGQFLPWHLWAAGVGLGHRHHVQSCRVHPPLMLHVCENGPTLRGFHLMTTSDVEPGGLIREYRADTAAEFWMGSGLLLAGWGVMVFGLLIMESEVLFLVGSVFVFVGGSVTVKAFLGRRRRLRVHQHGLVLC